MTSTLALLRKAKGMSQLELGLAVAEKLGDKIGTTYAQKKIARFESGKASPTAREAKVIAALLGVDLDTLQSAVSRAPNEGGAYVRDQIAGVTKTGRCLICSCMLSGPRSTTLDESAAESKKAIENNKTKIAVFVPFPGKLGLPEITSDDTHTLFGYYAGVRRSVLDSNSAFKQTLEPSHRNNIALYYPREDVYKGSGLLLPPGFRQFILFIRQDAEDGPFVKNLMIWTPGVDGDEARPARETAVYSIDEEIILWEAFFGGIVTTWMASGELTTDDSYWTKVNQVNTKTPISQH